MIRFLELLGQPALISATLAARMTSPLDAQAIDMRALRAPLTDADRVLVTETHLWLRRIPGPFQPKRLCRFYPRVANRLAQCWDDPIAFKRLLLDLLVDRRGGRAGFAPRIVVELQVLGRFRERQSEASWRKRLHEQARRILGQGNP